MYNESFIFYDAFRKCNWPCESGKCSESSLKAFMISDTHLLGERKGHWLDKLKREWQMAQAFRISTYTLSPDIVFFLGDLMDEGQWAGVQLFGKYAERFRELFGNKTRIVTLAGNHDLGFHYAIMPDTLDMFAKEFGRGLIDEIVVKGQRFVLINSMAMHGDGCSLCHEAEMQLEDIKRRNLSDRPIVLQHFPLFRTSDAECEKVDDQHEIDRAERYREQWETLSEQSTQKLISSLKPLAVFGGHTHKMCKKRWRRLDGPAFYEYTVNSFSWRNGDVPGIFLVVVDGEKVMLAKSGQIAQIFHVSLYSTMNQPCYDLLNPEARPLLAFIVGSDPPSECLVKCTEPMRRPLLDLVNHELTKKSKDKICHAFNTTKTCILNSNCSTTDRVVVEKLTYGFAWACGEHGYDPFKYLYPCIYSLGKEIRRQDSCKAQCNATIDGNKLLMASKSPNLISRLEHTCEPLACFLNCTAKQMNTYCPTSGSRFIHVIVSAFDELGDEYMRTTQTEQTSIMQNVPKKCAIFFDEKEMEKLRFDELFISDLFFMITSRKQRSRQSAVLEADRIVMDLVERMQVDMTPQTPLVWDLKAVTICAAIVVIMALNVVGLIFTVWWCLTSRDEDGTENSRSSMALNQFVEPNIRMKLKLPKLKPDALRDSEQDVLELRVPRNGNQFHQNDEQTVVVPRFKRRRTYSVPLEPRPRTQSTGSDRFPQIVIVRSNEN
ncbi:unnamed protein product [Caenorhabditis sp. 36 PRJEB53466]|nr:unnamed protein product [Caenorhabditis sp. 36 PRJEB53466]